MSITTSAMASTDPGFGRLVACPHAHVITIARQMPQPTFRHLTPSRVAGAEEYDSRLHATASRVNQCLVRLRTPQTDNITGTSTSTPTTVANAAPNSAPNRAMAVAATNRKSCWPRSTQRARHRDQHNMNGLAHDVLGLEGQDEDQCEEQDRDCDRGKSR